MIETCDESPDQIQSIIDQLAIRFTKKSSNIQAEKMFKGIGSNLLSRYDTSLEKITKKQRSTRDILRKALQKQNTYS